MYSPAIADALRNLGHDVIAVAERPDLRAGTDADIFAWAAEENRWLLTENVRDFRPLLLGTMKTGSVATGVLFSSSRAFPRSRKNPGPIIQALHGWLTSGPPEAPVTEDWLGGPPS
jgi:Domain of unknown function (DUF5615)